MYGAADKNEALRKEGGAVKNRLIALLIAAAIAAGVGFAGFAYSGFVSDTIYEESTAHLVEIFHQANQALYNMVSVNWSRMRMWAPYIEAAKNEQDIVTYVNQAREESNFTDYFFISIISPLRGRRAILIYAASLRI